MSAKHRWHEKAEPYMDGVKRRCVCGKLECELASPDPPVEPTDVCGCDQSPEAYCEVHPPPVEQSSVEQEARRIAKTYRDEQVAYLVALPLLREIERLRDEAHAHYQPQIDFWAERARSWEARARRWNSDEPA